MAYIKQAAIELGIEQKVVKRDVGKVLVKLEALQEEQIQKTLEPKEVTVILSEAEKKEAMKLLRDPKIESRIIEDLEACGVVGEETNKLVLYLSAISRLLRKPLAVAVIGGLLSSTLLTLVFIPVVYSYFESILSFFRRLFRRAS